MPKHENKQCPRCNKGFECKSGSILLCQCSKIEVTTEQIEYIKSHYDDCLCLSCLNEISTEHNDLIQNESVKNSLSGRS